MRSIRLITLGPGNTMTSASAGKKKGKAEKKEARKTRKQEQGDSGGGVRRAPPTAAELATVGAHLDPRSASLLQNHSYEAGPVTFGDTVFNGLQGVGLCVVACVSPCQVSVIAPKPL